MGQEIVYCFKCQTRIVGADFAKGAAFQVGNRVCCAKCASEVLQTLPIQEREQLLKQMFKATHERRSSGSSAAIPAAKPPLTSSSSKMRAVAAGPPGGVERRKSGNTARRLWERRTRHSLVMAVAAAAVMAVVVILMLKSSGGTATPPEPSAPVAKAPTPDSGPGPSAEHEEVRKARAFTREHPEDLEGQIAQWRGALLVVDSRTAETVQKELDRVLSLQKSSLQAALATLDLQTKPHLENEEFGIAAGLLRASRSRYVAPEWTLEVDRKIDKIRSDPVALMAEIRTKAGDARRRNAADELQVLRARVRKWGQPDLLVEFESLLADAPEAPPAAPAPTPAPAPAIPKELEAYRAAWDLALGRAAAGDPAAATQDLTAAGQRLTDAAAKAEAANDLEWLGRMGAALLETREAIGRTPKGQRIALERWNDLGNPEKIEGTVVGAEPGRLILRTDAGVVAVETGELTLGAIANLFAARPSKKPGDERTVALLALLDGDADRAAKLKIDLPDRWLKAAGRSSAALLSGQEGEARRLYAEAEDAAADPSRIATALKIYKTLLSDYGSTAFVARNRTLLGARSTLGKEFVFFPDMLRGSGTFKLAKAGKMDAVWLSQKDSDPASAPQNYVELAFTALPDSEYHLWVYAGACCLETFAFGVQGTDFVLPTARTTPAEPGAADSIPIRPPFSLKKTHAMHTGPKSPARWEWIPIPLPKYASPGVKVVRLLTNQQGFAVAYAGVSALTSSSPRESEVKDLEKSRPGRRAESAAEKEIPGLVGHWRLDEGAGDSAADVSRKLPPATLHGASWTTGRWGSALRFDGGNSWLDLPNTPALDSIAEGSYTILAWFQPDDLPAGANDQNNASYAIVVRCGLHSGFYYNGNGTFSFMQWFSKNEDQSQTSNLWTGTKPFPAGVFYHVAAVLDRGSGKAMIYVNGKLEATSDFDAGGRAYNYGSTPWRVGIGAPGYPVYRWCAKGVIDEIRFYNRALGAGEVEAVSRIAGPPAPRQNVGGEKR
jgi:hypothetical protein